MPLRDEVRRLPAQLVVEKLMCRLTRSVEEVPVPVVVPALASVLVPALALVSVLALALALALVPALASVLAPSQPEP